MNPSRRTVARAASIIVQHAQLTAGKVFALERLLVLGLMAPPALAVPDRLREVRMAARR